MLKKLNIDDANLRTFLFPCDVILSREDSPKSKENGDYMANIPYDSIVGTVMYAMLCTSPNIVHGVGVVFVFMCNIV